MAWIYRIDRAIYKVNGASIQIENNRQVTIPDGPFDMYKHLESTSTCKESFKLRNELCPYDVNLDQFFDHEVKVICNWISKNLTDKWYYTKEFNRGTYCWIFGFELESDAIACKLRWVSDDKGPELFEI